MGRWAKSRPTSTAFTSVVLRAVGLRVAVLGAIGACVLAGQALAVDAPAQPQALPVEQVVDVPPVWSPADAADFPGCVALSAWPTGRPAPYLVVQRVREEGRRRLAFDRAWRLNHNASEADDLWVLGVCAG